jgi:hypothetical protein
LRHDINKYETKPTFSAQNLRNTILLMQEALLVDFIKQAPFPIPGRDGSQVLLTFLFRPDVAHLDNNEGVFAGWARGEENVSVEFAGSAFNAVPEVFDEGRSGCSVEPTVERRVLYFLGRREVRGLTR